MMNTHACTFSTSITFLYFLSLSFSFSFTHTHSLSPSGSSKPFPVNSEPGKPDLLQVPPPSSRHPPTPPDLRPALSVTLTMAAGIGAEFEAVE